VVTFVGEFPQHVLERGEDLAAGRLGGAPLADGFLGARAPLNNPQGGSSQGPLLRCS